MAQLSAKSGELTYTQYMSWPENERATGVVILQALEGLPLDLGFIDALRRGLQPD